MLSSLKIASLFCLIAATTLPLVFAQTPPPCNYAETSCDGSLPDEYQEDSSIPSVDMWKQDDNSYKRLYEGGHYVAEIKNNQLHLFSSVYTGQNRLRVFEITTNNGEVTYVYIKDNESCLSDVGGNMPKTGASIKGVKLMTVKG